MKDETRKKVFAAISGGVDSSVAAALLKKRGFDVVGVHIKMWSDPDIPCTFKEDRYDAMAASAHLGIPFETWDMTEKYKQAVVEYMVREYAAGRTPNPDVVCNREIKFGMFLRNALERGADFVATGHYVKKSEIRNPKFKANSKSEIQKREIKLLKAADQNKDQSYFLWTLTQEQLRHCLFPIGEYTKPEVREMAREFGLPNAEKKDSQGICFIGEINVRKFLHRYIPTERGAVVTTSGKVIGTHEGLSFYTIGQRRGIGAGGGGIPYYAAEKKFASNTLIVSEGPYDERLFSRECVVSDVNWISGIPPRFPLRCKARIRYRQPLQICTVYKFISSKVYKFGERKTYQLTNLSTYKLRVVFDSPQRAVTPGQSVVLYRGEEVLGGGVIQ